MLGLPLTLGALVVGVLAALLIGALSQRAELREDAAIGVVFAGAFALGVALISLKGDYAVDLTHILFGDLLGVTESDLWLMAALSLLALGSVGMFYKEFLVLAFDPILARTLRLPVSLLQNALLVLLAVVIVISIQAVGVALVLAMLVTPASAAYLVSRRLPHMMAVAAGLGLVSAVLGLYASYYLNVASGPAIVLAQTAFFGLIFGFNSLRRRKSALAR
jgi:ABC-type Mn2+/Zn2+ transport system permease subunit